MKKERRPSSDDSIATEISDELSVDGGFAIAIEAGAAGYKEATSTNNGDKRKRTLFAFIGLVVVALVVCLSVGVVGLTKKRDSDPSKGQQVTSGTESSADKKDIAQDEKPKSSSAGTPTASPTPSPTNAVFLTDGGFECTEHASCRCYDEEICESRKGVFSTHTLEYDECEKKCLVEEDCNG